MPEDFQIGDKVCVDELWGHPIGGKTYTILDIDYTQRSQTHVMIKIDGYPNYLDSAWLRLVAKKQYLLFD